MTKDKFEGYFFMLSISAFAERVGVSTETVRSWIKDNRIPSHKIGKRRLINVDKLRDSLESDED
ncbi:helix-turn-helix domain-containing protein [uncultured Endozoicomonas sp.]|uniref:helix-turn-helix domain-containing protein n=1 Tax=uncultured Endozoicomonas sp. TaxID=432652 RepID=UPI0026387651|nr:helix-turn-helix domain-containing protein [uncultured Endozoicomonas sp.]